jgi:hypothetical protein
LFSLFFISGRGAISEVSNQRQSTIGLTPDARRVIELSGAK